jgi:hypothetical protein
MYNFQIVICINFILIFLFFNLNNILVKIFFYIYNLQIKKAYKFKIENKKYISYTKLYKEFIVSVKLSKAICLLFVNLNNCLLWNRLFTLYISLINSSYCQLNIKIFSIKTKSILKKYFSTHHNKDNIIFNQWLARLIDGDGCFLLSKKGYASLELVMEIRNQNSLTLIKDKLGGSLHFRSGKNWVRYRLHNKIGLLPLINAVNGEIRNPVRLLQLKKICENSKYNITLIHPSPLPRRGPLGGVRWN